MSEYSKYLAFGIRNRKVIRRVFLLLENDSKNVIFHRVSKLNLNRHFKNISKPYILKGGTSWNHLERAGTTQTELEPPRTSWNYLEPPVTRWIRQRAGTHKKEIHTKRVYVQYHCPIEYNISNSYCNNKHNFRCLKMEHLEQNVAGNELTQIKTLIGEYCMYNIISQQNITL